MQIGKFFGLACITVLLFDALASFASLVIGFNYGRASFVSAVMYIAFTFFCARKFGFGTALLLGAAMGLTDATLGWAISWAIGPGRLAAEIYSPSAVVFTAVLMVVLGLTYGLIGGGLGVFTKRSTAA
jgi:hypothetical protein